MPWVAIKSPTVDMLEKLMLEALTRATSTCHDCGAGPGEPHKSGCDTARCLTCGGQRLSCGCTDDKGAGDIWTGLWPGTLNCFEYGLVCQWEGPEPLLGWGSRGPTFDYNSEAYISRRKKKPKRLLSFREFLIKYRVKPELINPIYTKKREIEGLI